MKTQDIYVESCTVDIQVSTGRLQEAAVWYNTGMVHLHVKSCYSLYESTVRIEQLVQKAKECGQTHAVLSDHTVMYGAAAFRHACRKAGITPVFALEADVQYRDGIYPFELIAKDHAGFRSLMHLSSRLRMQEAEYASVQDIQECLTHCFLIVYGEGSYLDGAFIKEGIEELMERLKQLREDFGTFDVGLSYQESSMWQMRNQRIRNACHPLQIPTVALSKVWYMKPQDAATLRMLKGIRDNLPESDRSLPMQSGRWYRNEEEMRALYPMEELQRADWIVSQCSADGMGEISSLPSYQSEKNVPAEQLLPAIARAGLAKRLNGRNDPVYTQRLEYELSVIRRMHFEDYFLIVYDSILYARRQGIFVGPGRGSSVSSLTAYCLGITQLDPIEGGFLFERFLNPERISMPDIDIDLPADRRNEVVRYLEEKYGADHVASILAFNTFAARSAVQNAAEYLGVSDDRIRLLTRRIKGKDTLASAYEKDGDLRRIIASDDRFEKAWQLAAEIEGLPQHVTRHACGIVLSSRNLRDVIPVCRGSDDMTCTQFTDEWLEERGLIKMDYLSIIHLSVIDAAVQQIKEKDPSFSILKIPRNDPHVFSIFARGETAGIYQFDHEGAKVLLRRIRPSCFEDIAAVSALNRPAAAESREIYIQNHRNPSSVRYMNDDMKRILEETYGVMLYQEQAMLAAQYAAGFSLGRADTMRKAIKDKSAGQMQALESDFLRGCRKNGYTEEQAKELFHTVSQFSGYGFNKSHAYAYALISYMQGWLKANYPLCYYKSLLDRQIGSASGTRFYITECRRSGITVSNPDINRSTDEYLAEGLSLRAPLTLIKGITSAHAELIRKDREVNGPYVDFFDFTSRMIGRRIPENTLGSLIDAGAFDGFGIGRKTLREGMAQALQYADLIRIPNGDTMILNLNLVSKPVLRRYADNAAENDENEKRAFGFYFSSEPVTRIREQYNIQLPTLAVLSQQTGRVEGFARILALRRHRDKTGKMMAFTTLSDETGKIEMRVFSSLYGRVAEDMQEGTYIVFRAKMTDDGSLNAEDIKKVITI